MFAGLPPIQHQQPRQAALVGEMRDCEEQRGSSNPDFILAADPGSSNSGSVAISSSHRKSASSGVVGVRGTAVRKSNQLWLVILADKEKTTIVSQDELLDPAKFLVHRAYADQTMEQRRVQDAKRKRARKSRAEQNERRLTILAKEKQRAADRKEYDNLLSIFKSPQTIVGNA